MRGYCGIGIQAAKTPENVGGLWRSAHAFGAAFIFTVGHRYPHQPTDTTKAQRHVPLYEHRDVDGFLRSIPSGASLVGIECGDHARRTPRPLADFTHPERAVYVLGAEDRGLDREVQDRCDSLVSIPSGLCLNVATAGAIVLYDRTAKLAPVALTVAA